jgi:glycosyltransferase involved in cell wall biosynthesis
VNKRPHNILHISIDFNYSCGVSNYVYSLLKDFNGKKSYKLYFITNGGDAIDKLLNINITPTFLSYSKGIRNIFNIFSNLKDLREFCIENKIEIIHTHHRYPEYLSYLIAKNSDIKTVTTAHSLVNGRSRFSFKSDKVIAVSNSVSKMLTNHYKVPSEKLVMMHNYLQVNDKGNTNKLDIKTNIGIPKDGKIILFIGRISKIKGVDLLINAFNLLNQKYDKLFLLIIGQLYDKSLNSILKKLPPRVVLLGVVKNPYPYYSIADLVVLPSRTDPYPYVMLESGIMKRPFLGARTGGIEEFIEDEVDGVLFSPGNVLELKSKIEFIINNRSKAQEMAENLYQKVKKQTSPSNYMDQLCNIYDELLII